MDTLPDHAIPDQSPAHVADDLLTDIRTALRSWERQPQTGRDTGAGVAALVQQLAAHTDIPGVRSQAEILAGTVHRARTSRSPEIRTRALLAARVALAELDRLVAVARLSAHEAEHRAARHSGVSR
jgi:hypothetical protein